MCSHFLMLTLVLLVSVVEQQSEGKSVLVKRDAGNDSDEDIQDLTQDLVANMLVGLDDDLETFNEAMDNMSSQVQHFIEQFPEEQKTERTKMQVVDGYDVKTKETIINGTIGDIPAVLEIGHSQVLHKHKDSDDDKTKKEEKTDEN